MEGGGKYSGEEELDGHDTCVVRYGELLDNRGEEEKENAGDEEGEKKENVDAEPGNGEITHAKNGGREEGVNIRPRI
ncbi:hypothetical protein ADUPG1_005557, partial [Aduncisulcus paluster]